MRCRRSSGDRRGDRAQRRPAHPERDFCSVHSANVRCQAQRRGEGAIEGIGQPRAGLASAERAAAGERIVGQRRAGGDLPQQRPGRQRNPVEPGRDRRGAGRGADRRALPPRLRRGCHARQRPVVELRDRGEPYRRFGRDGRRSAASCRWRGSEPAAGSDRDRGATIWPAGTAWGRRRAIGASGCGS